MKAKYNLLISAVCYGIILWYYICYFEIILHPYMMFVIIMLFIAGGFNAGVGIGKMVNEYRHER